MSTIVIIPGGFHPFHSGHMSLYNAARKAFPDAQVYVAATNSQEERPFPFAIKEKLAKVSGVKPGSFVQVKSPFQSKEITQHYDPENDILIFVRSEKDRNESPKPGGMKKDGTPAYFQPYTGENLAPFSKHAYFAYLPTVKFGPGIQSATEIRKAWPTLDDRRKTAMVMSLYPSTQKNPKLAQNVVQLLDMGMGGIQDVAESKRKEPTDSFDAIDPETDRFMKYAQQHYPNAPSKQQAFIKYVQRALKHSEEEDTEQDSKITQLSKEIEELKQAVAQTQVTESRDYIDEK